MSHHQVEGRKRQRDTVGVRAPSPQVVRRSRSGHTAVTAHRQHHGHHRIRESATEIKQVSIRTALVDPDDDEVAAHNGRVADHNPMAALWDAFDSDNDEDDHEPVEEDPDAEEEEIPLMPVTHRGGPPTHRLSILRDRSELRPAPAISTTIDIHEELEAARRLIGNRDVSDMDYEELLALQEVCGVVGRGLSKRRIEKYTTRMSADCLQRWVGEQASNRCGKRHHHRPCAQDADTNTIPNTLPRCTVCLDDFVASNDDDGNTATTCRKIDACGHVFHSDCIVQWLQKEKCCPVCRCEVCAPTE